MRPLPLNLLPAFLLLTWLTACSSLGLAPAQSFNQKLAYALTTHTAIVTSATNALNAGTIKAADAEAVLKLATDSRTLLDAASAVHEAGDVAGGDTKLALAVGILGQLQTFLTARGVKS